MDHSTKERLEDKSPSKPENQDEGDESSDRLEDEMTDLDSLRREDRDEEEDGDNCQILKEEDPEGFLGIFFLHLTRVSEKPQDDSRR